MTNLVYEKYVSASCQYSQRISYGLLLMFALFSLDPTRSTIPQLFWTLLFFGVAMFSTMDQTVK